MGEGTTMFLEIVREVIINLGVVLVFLGIVYKFNNNNEKFN